METPQNYNDILARVDQFNLSVKQAKEASSKEAGATKIPEEDPRDKGEKGVPSLDEADDTKRTNNDQSNEDAKLEDESTHPVSTGKNVPSTQDGNAKEDAFTEPTTPLSKIAGIGDRVKAVSSRIDSFRKGAATGGSKPGESKQEDAEGKSKKSASKADAEKAEGEKEDGSKEANTELSNDYSDEFLRKLAYAICETEGGLEAVEPILLKHAGQEEARELMKRASEEYDQFVQLSEQVRQEELQKMAYEAQSLQAAEELLKNASEEERAEILKVAEEHFKNSNEYNDDFLKYAYMGGAGDAAAMMDAEAAAPEGEEAGLPGAAQGEPSIEEIVQLLDAMVASGEIDEATAAQVVEQLAGGAAGGGGEEAPMPPEAGGAPEGGAPMPPEAGGGEAGMVAEASDKSLDDLCKELITKPE